MMHLLCVKYRWWLQRFCLTGRKKNGTSGKTHLVISWCVYQTSVGNRFNCAEEMWISAGCRRLAATKNWELQEGRNMWLHKKKKKKKESLLFFTMNADCSAKTPEGKKKIKQTIEWKNLMYESRVFSPRACDSRCKVQVQPLLTRNHEKRDTQSKHTHTHTPAADTMFALALMCETTMEASLTSLRRQRIECVCCYSVLWKEICYTLHTTPYADSWHGNQRRKTYSCISMHENTGGFYNSTAWWLQVQ